jgi:hypothetical protein
MAEQGEPKHGSDGTFAGKDVVHVLAQGHRVSLPALLVHADRVSP